MVLDLGMAPLDEYWPDAAAAVAIHDHFAHQLQVALEPHHVQVDKYGR